MLMFMTALSVYGSATNLTFGFRHNSVLITSTYPVTPRIFIYKNGETLTSSNSDVYDFSGEVNIEIGEEYTGQTVSYRSSLGHQGTLTLSGSNQQINLDCKELTYTSPSSSGSIEFTNGLVKFSTYSSSATLYFAPGEYSYSYYSYSSSSLNKSGIIDMTTDNILDLSGGSGNNDEEYALTIVCRYGDFPIGGSTSDDGLYLYRYGTRDNFTSLAYDRDRGVYSGQVTAGSYWVRDRIGAYSGKIEVDGDKTVWIDYHKVTFSVKTESTPNANINIKVNSAGNTDYSSISESLTTNSRGEASVYLMPGEYTYTIAGGSGNFTVGEEDKTVSVSTSRVVITLNSDDPSAMATQRFEMTTGNNSYSQVTAVDGKLVMNVLPGNYKLRVNGIATMDVSVAEGENTVSVQLYSLMFTSNLTTPPALYLSSNSMGNNMGYNVKTYLPAGEYSYWNASLYSSSPIVHTLTLNENKTIALNYAKLTVTVSDTNGAVVDNQRIWIGGYYASTDQSGKVSFTLLVGSYALSVDNVDGVDKTIELTSDTEETLTIPAYVTFNVLKNGQPYGGSLDLRKDGSYYYTSGTNGVAKARITPGQAYELSGYKGKAVITEGCTINLGTLKISNDGMGLAFPRDEWDADSKFDVVVGSAVRLTAIPVTDDKFQHWTINGTDYDEPVIDLVLTEVNTDAKAVFGGSVASGVRQVELDASVQSDDNYIYLPEGTEGTARIYTFDGRLTKSIGVVGGQIGIYDLPAGAYILSFKGNSGVQNARFIKK